MVVVQLAEWLLPVPEVHILNLVDCPFRKVYFKSGFIKTGHRRVYRHWLWHNNDIMRPVPEVLSSNPVSGLFKKFILSKVHQNWPYDFTGHL